MKPAEVMVKIDNLFINSYPTANSEYLGNGFRDILNNLVSSHELDHLVIKPDGEIDTDWISFLWWVHYGNLAYVNKDSVRFACASARINDVIHGFIWTPEGNGYPLRIGSSLDQYLATNPIVRAEHIKIKDYLKHINWVYHKTQVLPRITLIGSDNVPERLYGIRQSEITVLDPKTVFPKETLFVDHIQRRNFKTVDSKEVLCARDKKGNMLDTQNVVIIDFPGLSIDELEQNIIKAGMLLTQHGRCLFDVPMYGKIFQETKLYGIVAKFTKSSTTGASPSLAVIDDYIHEVVFSVNHSEDVIKANYYFTIEELKLTDVGLSRSVAVRIYLKKIGRE